jgi:hypothetical protein
MPRVKTLPGEKCPLEGKHREYITDDPKGVEVPDTIYYRRLQGEGSLISAEKPAKIKEGSAHE